MTSFCDIKNIRKIIDFLFNSSYNINIKRKELSPFSLLVVLIEVGL